MKTKTKIIIAIIAGILVIAGVITTVVFLTNRNKDENDEESETTAVVSVLNEGPNVIGVKLVYPEHINNSQTADITVLDKNSKTVGQYHYNIFEGYVIDEIAEKKYTEVTEYPGWKAEYKEDVCWTKGEDEMYLYLPKGDYNDKTITLDFLNKSYCLHYNGNEWTVL